MATKKPASTTPATYVVLLRGINVGGKNKLPMKELAQSLAAIGCSDVRTYIQSGNVVLRAGGALASALPARVQACIERHFGLQVPVVVRSADELAQIARDNPYLAAGVDPSTLHVAFLADARDAKQLAKLDAKRSPPDAFTARALAIYLHLPNGVAKTKLSNDYFDRTLQTVSTVRNWRTVCTLIELSGGRAP